MALCKNPVQSRAVILQPAIGGVHAERHFARLRWLADFAPQKLDEIWIRAVIENDETGIDSERPIAFLHVDRIGVATDIAGRLIHRDIEVVTQLVSGHVACDTGTDDRYLQRTVSASNTACYHCCGTRSIADTSYPMDLEKPISRW